MTMSHIQELNSSILMCSNKDCHKQYGSGANDIPKCLVPCGHTICADCAVNKKICPVPECNRGITNSIQNRVITEYVTACNQIHRADDKNTENNMMEVDEIVTGSQLDSARPLRKLYKPEWDGQCSLKRRFTYFSKECTEKQARDILYVLNYRQENSITGSKLVSRLMVDEKYFNNLNILKDKLCEFLKRKNDISYARLLAILGEKNDKWDEKTRSKHDNYSQCKEPLLDQRIDFQDPELIPAFLVFCKEKHTDKLYSLGRYSTQVNPIQFLKSAAMACYTVRGLLNHLDHKFGVNSFPNFKNKLGIKQSTELSGNGSESSSMYAAWPEVYFPEDVLNKELNTLNPRDEPHNTLSEMLSIYWESSDLCRDQLKMVFTPELGAFSTLEFEDFKEMFYKSTMTLNEFINKCRENTPYFNLLLYPATGSVGRPLPAQMEDIAIMEFAWYCETLPDRYLLNGAVLKLSDTLVDKQINLRLGTCLGLVNPTEDFLKVFNEIKIKGVTIGALLTALKDNYRGPLQLRAIGEFEASLRDLHNDSRKQ